MVIMIEVLWAFNANVITNLKGLYNNHNIRMKDITQENVLLTPMRGWIPFLALHTPDMVIYSCNFSTQEAETGESGI